MNPLPELWRRAIEPPPDLKPWEWCAENVQAIPYSPQPGPFDPDYHPAIKPIMEAIADPRASIVVIRGNVQSIKTLACEMMITWSVVNDPGPTLFLQAQDPEAADEMKTRLRPLWDHVPAVRDLLPSGIDRTNMTRDTVLFRNGMALWVLGAHNTRNLQRRTIRRVLMDECWQYPPGRMGEAMARVTAFGFMGKVVASSQAGEPDDDFDRLWQRTDQAEWTFRCHECGTRQPFAWSQIEFEPIKDEAGDYDYRAIAETVRMNCAGCDATFSDSDETRRDLNATGQFIAANDNADVGISGFGLNALSSMRWAALVEEYLRAKVASWSGDYGALKIWHQKRMAKPFGDSADEDFSLGITGAGYAAADEWEDEAGLATMGGAIRILPKWEDKPGVVRLRILSVDVQRDHFWAVVRSVAEDGRTRLTWAGKLSSYEEIHEMQKAREIHHSLVFIDCGDKPFSNAGVYAHAAKFGWTCLRGDGRESFPHRDRDRPNGRVLRYYSPVRKVPIGGTNVRVHHWSNLSVKDILHNLQRLPERWQTPDDLAELCPSYEEQMSSERRVKRKAGKGYVWEVVGKRPNHLRDCECQIVAALLMLRLIGQEVGEGEKKNDEDGK